MIWLLLLLFVVGRDKSNLIVFCLHKHCQPPQHAVVNGGEVEKQFLLPPSNRIELSVNLSFIPMDRFLSLGEVAISSFVASINLDGVGGKCCCSTVGVRDYMTY